jgi:hypothetical protein
MPKNQPQPSKEPMTPTEIDNMPKANTKANTKKTTVKMIQTSEGWERNPEEYPEPQRFSERIPRAAETPKTEMENKGALMKGTGPYTPKPKAPQQALSTGSRPTTNQGQKEQGSTIIAKHLGPQLGTDPDILAQGRWDERKLAILDENTLAALSHFSHRYIYDGVRYYGHITEWWLVGSQGVGGLGRQHILKALMFSSGGQNVEKANKPNVISRNLFNRGWKEKAAAEGKEVEE